VETAFSGAEAVAAVETRDYDLVFMDVQMPEMSGLEATRRIRAIKNDRKNVPIIAMTAHDVTLYEQRCHEAGMDDFISKPFNIQHIAEIIKACTEGKYGKGLKPVITPEPMTLPVEALLLDVAVGMLVFDNDAVRYDNFLKEFMEGLPKRLEKMTIALNAEAWELLGNEAHNLKGISANLGAGKISNRASQLEAQSRERTEEPAHSTLREIEDAISELMEQAPHIISMLLKSSNNKRDT
jgi:CheY-like chemotaxis protein/HPt (histidine-containing phosphotransfer) domain-containing protein